MGNFIVSQIRTWVPVIVGSLVGWGLLPESLSEQAVIAFSGLTVGVYYLLVRLLETKVHPGFGWLLGIPKPPEYTVTP